MEGSDFGQYGQESEQAQASPQYVAAAFNSYGTIPRNPPPPPASREPLPAILIPTSNIESWSRATVTPCTDGFPTIISYSPFVPETTSPAVSAVTSPSYATLPAYPHFNPVAAFAPTPLNYATFQRPPPQSSFYEQGSSANPAQHLWQSPQTSPTWPSQFTSAAAASPQRMGPPPPQSLRQIKFEHLDPGDNPSPATAKGTPRKRRSQPATATDKTDRRQAKTRARRAASEEATGGVPPGILPFSPTSPTALSPTTGFPPDTGTAGTMPPPSRSQPRRGGGKKRAPTGTPKQPAAAADDSNSDNEGDDASSPSTTTTTSTPLRSTHNQIERNYRNRVNAEFDSLRAVLPPTADDPLKERKLSKAEVLIQSRHYILSLEAEVRCSGAEKAALWDTWNRLYHTQYHQQPPPSPLGSSGGPGPGSGPGAPDRSGVLQR